MKIDEGVIHLIPPKVIVNIWSNINCFFYYWKYHVNQVEVVKALVSERYER
jgi:hypothetical protein